jgi:hypothetical protein
VNTDQGGGVVRHDGHPHLHDGAAMAFVREVCGATAQQAGNDAFDHRSAVPTGAGEIYLGRRPYAVQLCLVQDSEDILCRERRGEGIDGFRDPHGENPLYVQRLTQGNVIEREIARERVDDRGGARRNPGDGVLHFVNQGLHILDVTGIPHGQMQGKDEASRWLGDNPRLAAELGGAIAFAFANGRNRGIVGIDDFAVAQRLALRQPTGLGFDPLMGLERGREPGVQARPLVLPQLRPTVQALLPGPRQGFGGPVSQTLSPFPGTGGRSAA